MSVYSKKQTSLFHLLYSNVERYSNNYLTQHSFEYYICCVIILLVLSLPLLYNNNNIIILYYSSCSWYFFLCIERLLHSYTVFMYPSVYGHGQNSYIDVRVHIDKEITYILRSLIFLNSERRGTRRS